jgi:3-hydroxyacyl-CoA dehydrogenase
MMTIRKAAVIGSGTMGGGIAALLAGVGVQTVLLDIPAKGTQPGDPPALRNSVAADGLKRLSAARPAAFFSAEDADLITVGNLDDDLDIVADADWIIEVVVERLDIKQNLMAKLAEIIAPHTMVSTNTSGLPIHQISAGLGADFKRRFLGTHFFNPPRYLHLLEVIPGVETDPDVVRAISDFAATRLGKGVVLCKDEPNFIGNRFMTMIGMHTVNATLDGAYTVDEIDALTGPLIGRPKTASYRLNDLVGIDIAVHVARNLYPAIPHDPARTVLEDARTTALFDKLMANGWLGNKSGQGFYKSVKNAAGEREFWTLNLDSFEYQPPSKPRFESVGKHRSIADTGARIKALIGETDRAGRFLFDHFAFYLAYASHRVPEITETIVNIDNAQKWGFSHELGPFEIWDALGVSDTVGAFESAGYPIADWVKAMLDAGQPTFYQRDAAGQITGYYSPQAAAVVSLTPDPRAVRVAGWRASDRRVAGNDSASVLDMGDGIALLELHSPAQALNSDVIKLVWTALDLLHSRFDGLVIGSEAERFCVGANLVGVAMAVQGGELGQLERLIKQSQDMMQALHYAAKPVVIAPYNIALGGGAELIMAGARVVAHMELYAGLVEFGVGLIPGSGGCKEMLRRIVNPVMAAHPNADALPHLQKIFEQLSTAKVSESAKGARDLGFLSASDRIVLHRGRLLGEAKREVLHMADGYTPQRAGKIYAAGRDAYAALLLGVENFREGGFASEHDAVIARKLAYVLTGGAISEPGWVDEQVILDLERTAFLELVQMPKTLERMAHMVATSKPLRN